MSNFLLSQILAGGVIILDIVTFQLKRREMILSCFVASVLLLSAHFWLLDQHTASLLMMVAAARYFVCIFWIHPALKYISLVLVVILGILTYSGWLSVLGTVASILATLGSCSAHDKQVRLWTMCASSCWAVHNVIVQTPIGVLTEVIFLCSNLVGYYRFYIRQQKTYDS